MPNPMEAANCEILIRSGVDGRHALLLDERCWRCKGTGKRPIAEDACDICDGSGFLTTDNGNEFLAFVRRHIAKETP